MKRYALGIDIGGTFTDIVVYDAAAGRQFSRKELTTHADPSVGVMTGMSVADGGRCAAAEWPRGTRDDALQPMR